MNPDPDLPERPKWLNPDGTVNRDELQTVGDCIDAQAHDPTICHCGNVKSPLPLQCSTCETDES